jgi:hypothetical protein
LGVEDVPNEPHPGANAGIRGRARSTNTDAGVRATAKGPRGTHEIAMARIVIEGLRNGPAGQDVRSHSVGAVSGRHRLAYSAGCPGAMPLGCK